MPLVQYGLELTILSQLGMIANYDSYNSDIKKALRMSNNIPPLFFRKVKKSKNGTSILDSQFMTDIISDDGYESIMHTLLSIVEYLKNSNLRHKNLTAWGFTSTTTINNEDKLTSIGPLTMAVYELELIHGDSYFVNKDIQQYFEGDKIQPRILDDGDWIESLTREDKLHVEECLGEYLEGGALRRIKILPDPKTEEALDELSEKIHNKEITGPEYIEAAAKIKKNGFYDFTYSDVKSGELKIMPKLTNLKRPFVIYSSRIDDINRDHDLAKKIKKKAYLISKNKIKSYCKDGKSHEMEKYQNYKKAKAELWLTQLSKDNKEAQKYLYEEEMRQNEEAFNWIKNRD